jgi:hypothetical protein
MVGREEVTLPAVKVPERQYKSHVVKSRDNVPFISTRENSL